MLPADPVSDGSAVMRVLGGLGWLRMLLLGWLCGLSRLYCSGVVAEVAAGVVAVGGAARALAVAGGEGSSAAVFAGEGAAAAAAAGTTLHVVSPSLETSGSALSSGFGAESDSLKEPGTFIGI